jgi:hypothetical protein
MVKKFVQALFGFCLVFSLPASAMQILLSSVQGETVIVNLQGQNTFKLTVSRPLLARTSNDFETKPHVRTGSFEKQGEHIVLWDDARELGRIRLWDSSGKIQAQMFLADPQNAQLFWGLIFK